MGTKKTHFRIAVGSVFVVAMLGAGPVGAEGNFYIKPHVGVSILQDNDFDQVGIATPGATGEGEFDAGWAAGLGFGYRYAGGWSAEIDWEYRTNDNDKVAFSDGTVFEDGNLASNIIYLNGYYSFRREARLRPYVGAGLGWVQEIDFDLESGGTETSYSGDGDIAWQLMAGADTNLSESWRLQGELRYSRVTGVDLDQEGGTGEISALDYEAWTLGVGLIYDF